MKEDCKTCKDLRHIIDNADTALELAYSKIEAHEETISWLKTKIDSLLRFLQVLIR